MPPVTQTPPPVSLEVPPCDIENPGDIENPCSLKKIHQKCKNLFPFKGVQITPRSGSNQFHLSYTINQSSITPSGSNFDAIYVGTKQISPTEFLLGHFKLFSNLSATMCHQLMPTLHGKYVAQVKDSMFTVRQFSVKYKGPDYTLKATVVKPRLKSAPSAIVLSCLSSITTQLCMEVNVTIKNCSEIPLFKGTIAQMNEYAGLCCSLDDMGTCSLKYYQKVSEQIQFGVILQENMLLKKSVMAFGCQLDISEYDLTFKGQIAQDWTVGAVLEKRVWHLPLTFVLSGLMNCTKKQFRFGVGIIID